MLKSMGSQRVRHNLATELQTANSEERVFFNLYCVNCQLMVTIKGRPLLVGFITELKFSIIFIAHIACTQNRLLSQCLPSSLTLSSASFFLFFFFFNVDHFYSLYWICYSIASVLCFVFLARRQVQS